MNNLLLSIAKVVGAGVIGGCVASVITKDRNTKIDDFMKETDPEKAREIMKEIKIDAEKKRGCLSESYKNGTLKIVKK